MIPGLLVNIDVDDLAAAERFYREAFGLTVGRRFGDSGVELLGSAAPIYLLPKPAGSPPFPGATEPRSYRRHWSPVHLDFVVTELEVARDRAVAAGATLEQDIVDADWGRIAYFADPFGNGFCILAFSARGYDAIAT
jgi:predicted enzyme related to lactoylglutathione lyase